MIEDGLFQELTGTIEEAPVEELHAIIGQLEEVKSIVSFRLQAAAIRSSKNGAGEKDELLTVKQASARLKVSKNYLYQHSKKLPFTVSLLGRKILFSAKGIEEFIRRNQG